MMIMRRIVATAAVISLASCATWPDAILPATYTGSYGQMDCTGVSARSDRLERRLNRHVTAQEKRAFADGYIVASAISVALIFPPFALMGFFAKGNGEDAEHIARIKGEIDALDEEYDVICGPQPTR